MGRSPRIIHVDTDPDTVESVTEFLSGEHDMTVISAQNATEALDCVRENNIDCVVSAGRLADTNGIELCEQIRTFYPELPVVLFPRKGDEAMASKAVAAGVTAYVPHSDETHQIEQLADTVRDTIESKDEAVELSGVGYWEFEREQGTVYWSSGMYDLCGAPDDFSPTLEKTIEYYHPEDRATVRETVNHVVSTGEESQIEARICRGENEIRWIRSQIYPRDIEGTSGRVRITVQNITRYKTKITRLKHERERYASLFENLPNPVTYGVADSKAKEPIVLEVNSAFEETFGVEETEIEGEPLDRHIVPTDHRETAQNINETILEQSELQTEVKRKTPDGIRNFQLDINIRDTNNELFEGYAIYTDITEQKRYETELERKNERLDQFRSMISHDLRNPLTVAQLRLDLVENECDSEHLDEVADSLDRMEAMLHSMLMIARADTAVEDSEPIKLATIVGRAWQHIPSEDGTLETEIPAGFSVECDSDLVAHVFENLFDNAIEHGRYTDAVRIEDANTPEMTGEDKGDVQSTDEQTDVQSAQEPTGQATEGKQEDRTTEGEQENVTTEGEQEEVTTEDTQVKETAKREKAQPDNADQRSPAGTGSHTVTVTVGTFQNESGEGFFVADDGQGISQNEREQLFDRGYTTSQEGSGLGLAIVKDLIEAHGWSIEVTESSVGGARFDVYTSTSTESS